MKKKFILASLVLPLVGVERALGDIPFDPKVAEKQDALKKQGSDTQRQQEIRNCENHITALKGLYPKLIDQLKKRLRDEYKISAKDTQGINSIINYVDSLPSTKEFKDLLGVFEKAITNSIKEFKNISTDKLTNQHILEFAALCGGQYSNLSKHAQLLKEEGSKDLSNIVEKALQKERYAFCPKGPLGRENWRTLKKGEKVKIIEPSSKDEVIYRVKPGDEKNFPGTIQVASWKSLADAPLAAEQYDWKKSTLSCTYTYTSVGTGMTKYSITLLATR